MPAAPAPLFDSEFLARLEHLHLIARRVFRGRQRAERRSHQLGSSLEFADYRNYVRGDDLRSVDWNIYGRLDRLFLKLFEEEEDLHIYILVDASASMRWDSGAAATKDLHARKIAAALAYIGLANLDRVNIYFFAEQLGADLGLVRGKSQFHQVLAFLSAPPHENEATDLLASLRAFVQRVKRRGVVLLLSDFFDPRGYAEALTLLRAQRFEVQLIQVFDPAELDPRLSGDLRLLEAEGAAAYDVTVNEQLLRSYRREISTFLGGLERFCLERQINHAQALTTVPFDDVVLRLLRAGHFVR